MSNDGYIVVCEDPKGRPYTVQRKNLQSVAKYINNLKHYNPDYKVVLTCKGWQDAIDYLAEQGKGGSS